MGGGIGVSDAAGGVGGGTENDGGWCCFVQELFCAEGGSVLGSRPAGFVVDSLGGGIEISDADGVVGGGRRYCLQDFSCAEGDCVLGSGHAGILFDRVGGGGVGSGSGLDGDVAIEP